MRAVFVSQRPVFTRKNGRFRPYEGILEGLRKKYQPKTGVKWSTKPTVRMSYPYTKEEHGRLLEQVKKAGNVKIDRDNTTLHLARKPNGLLVEVDLQNLRVDTPIQLVGARVTLATNIKELTNNASWLGNKKTKLFLDIFGVHDHIGAGVTYWVIGHNPSSNRTTATEFEWSVDK